MSEMNYNQLKNSLDNQNLKNLYFLCGEPNLVKYFENRIILSTLGENYTAFDYVVLNEENFSNESFETSLNTFPITNTRKCIILKNLSWEEINNDDIKIFLELLKDIPEFAVVIIINISSTMGTKNNLKLSKIQDLTKDIGIFSNLSLKDFPIERQIVAWVRRDHGKTIEKTEVKKILEMCKGYQIHEIQNEVKKICEFEKGNTIKESSLEIIWKSKQKVNVYELPKALYLKNAKKCFDILSSLLSQGEEPLYILNAILGEYTDMYRVKLFLENRESPEKLLKIFDYKKKEFRIKNAVKSSSNLSLKEIEEIIFYFIQADEKLKSTNIDPKTVLSELITLILIKTNR